MESIYIFLTFVKTKHMKRLLLLTCLLFSLNGVSQSYEKFDKDLQIVRRDCELIIITTDSITATSLRETNGLNGRNYMF